MSHSCGNKYKDDSYIKSHCCQISLVQAAYWTGFCDLEYQFRKSEGRYFHQRFTSSNIFKGYKVAMRLISLQMRGGCNKKLHLKSYLEMLWSKTGYCGLYGNNNLFWTMCWNSRCFYFRDNRKLDLHYYKLPLITYQTCHILKLQKNPQKNSA